jgi:glycosyltransferase involved in cell wall biosynthesis
MVKRVMMIAFHYPPMQGSSGAQRTLNFVRHLPRHGWQPIVVSAHPRAYVSVGTDQLGEAGEVHRTFAIDAGRHLAIRGRYPSLLALPDRWISWWFGTIPVALRLIRRHRPDLIWSSYPVATAHLIGLTLNRLTGIPWVADLRDPMTDADYPPDRRTRAVFHWLEARTVARCARLVCTTPGAMHAYRTRFPFTPTEKLCLIENGYDEESFGTATPRAGNARRFILLHSGLIYPSERDPTALFAALSMLKNAGAIENNAFCLVLRASGHDDYLRAHIDALGLRGLIELAPALPYRAALHEMMEADGLLLLQAGNCNAQIPAKLYEYLRARRPILALTDPRGDTAAKLRACGIDTIAVLDSTPAIAHALLRFIELAKNGCAPLASMQVIASHSRAARSAELAALFDQTLEYP